MKKYIIFTVLFFLCVLFPNFTNGQSDSPPPLEIKEYKGKHVLIFNQRGLKKHQKDFNKKNNPRSSNYESFLSDDFSTLFDPFYDKSTYFAVSITEECGADALCKSSWNKFYRDLFIIDDMYADKSRVLYCYKIGQVTAKRMILSDQKYLKFDVSLFDDGT